MSDLVVAEKNYIKDRQAIVKSVKSILISSLNLEYTEDQIASDEILFGVGFGLDSIDSLQLTVGIKSELAVEIQESDMWALRSVNSIADYIFSVKSGERPKRHNLVKNYKTNNKSLVGYNEIRNQYVSFFNNDYKILLLNGEDELIKLNEIVTKDLDFTPEGSVTQALLLKDDGALISNVYFMNNFDHHYILLPVETSPKVLEILNLANIPFKDLTHSSTFFSVEGYQSTEIMENGFDSVVSLMKPYTFLLETLSGVGDFLVVRLDNYGEQGYLIVSFDAETKSALIQQFDTQSVKFSDVEKVLSKETKQLLWMESCQFDLSCSTLRGENVIEVGLSSMLSLEKDEFVGKLAVEQMQVEKRLVHFISEQVLKANQNIFFDNNEVGYVVACQYSPLLSCYIGNAYVSSAYSLTGVLLESEGARDKLKLVSAPQIVGHSYVDIV